MNDEIRKVAFEVKRYRELMQAHIELLEKGEYSHRVYVEYDEWRLRALEKILCDLVLAAIESEKMS